MSDMTFEKMVRQMTPEIYQSLKLAVERRKWPDGRMLSQEQLELCLETVIKYELEHKVPEEQRVGYIDRHSCGSHDEHDDHGHAPDPIKWVN